MDAIRTTTEIHHPPWRQVRATFDDKTLIVYQAYPPEIADAALTAGAFVPPFKLNRMTWIKPSFLWMMYRSEWASKPGQERILAVRIDRSAFEIALEHACLSQFEPQVHKSVEDWRLHKQTSTVRLQWDPERSLHLDPLQWRTIQIGLSGTSAHSYASQWITEITDITQIAHEVRRLLHEHNDREAKRLLPVERPYLLPPSTAKSIGISELSPLKFSGETDSFGAGNSQ